MSTIPPHLQRLRAAFDKWLFLPNYDTIDVVAATYLANQLPGARLWLCLLGPSSCGKTTMAESLLGLPNVHQVDAITAGSFSSGFRPGEDAKKVYSYFDRLSEGSHLLIVPDFSTILRHQPHVRNQVLAQLRRVYDGNWTQHFGSGVDVEWSGKVGLIACATPNYEREIASEATFGERFVYWKMRIINASSVAERSLRNSTSTDLLRNDLRAAMSAITKLKIPKSDIKLPLSIRNALSREVVFVSKARTPVIRDPHSKEILDMPHEESPARLSQQLGQLLKGLIVLYGFEEPSPELLEIVETCAYSTIPGNRLRIMGALGPGEARTEEIVRESGLPRVVGLRTLEELVELDLVSRTRSKVSTTHHPNSEFKPFFHRVRVVMKRAGYFNEEE